MNPSVARLLAATGLLTAEALRLEPPPRVNESAGPVRRVKSRGSLDAEAGHVPDVTTFERNWVAMNRSKDSAPVVHRIKLVVGIFTWSGEASYRGVIRKTWMTRPGICRASQGPQEGCSVFVTFVQGHSHSGSHSEVPSAEQGVLDTITLPIEENMDEGKTLHFFRFALLQYPWATHIGKMDTDVFPKWTVIMKGLERLPVGCDSYVGRPWVCSTKEFCPPLQCSPPTDEGQIRAYNDFGSCWIYMQGAFYVISKNLAAKATELDGHWQHHQSGPEDVMTGHAIAKASNKYNLCVSTWPKEFAQLEATHVHWRNRDLVCAPGWNTYYKGCK